MANSATWYSNPVLKNNAVPASEDMLVACALGMKILEFAGVRSWDDLGGQLPAMLRLTPDQAGAVSRHQYLCSVQRAKHEDMVKVSVIVCSDCSRWMMISSESTKPARCILSIECEGKLLGLPSCKRLTADPGPMHEEPVDVPASEPVAAPVDSFNEEPPPEDMPMNEEPPPEDMPVNEEPPPEEEVWQTAW